MAESRDITAQDARTAAQMETDVGVEHIAKVYAKALLDASEPGGQTAAAIEELDSFVTDLLDRFPKLEAILSSNLVSPEDKAGILDRTVKGRASPLVANFLKVVARHGRLDCLRAIRLQAHALDDQRRKRIPVTVTTVEPLSAAAVNRLVEGLRQKLGGEPVLQQQVDPGLIGGAVLRVGDRIYDGSIAHQLENLRQQIVDKSAHEIQSRRNRFRYPAGN